MIKIIQLNSGEMLIAKLNDDNHEVFNLKDEATIPLFTKQ